MLLFCRKDLDGSEREALLDAARDAGFIPQTTGPDRIILFGEGDASRLEDFPGVERLVEHLSQPLIAEGGGTTLSVVRSGGVSVGEGFSVIAGPCAVEGRTKLLEIAHAAKEAGADMLRGGAFKPRTSPYSFRGLGPDGLRYLAEAREATGLPVVTEVLDTRDVEIVADHADILQIGTRNMMNYALLVEAGRAGKPVLLKRGMSATVSEFICSAEYLLVEGCPGVVLCERGIRTFSNGLRFTLDIATVPAVKERTGLPVIVDPSHASGRSQFVPSLARAAAAAGAAGVLVEIHDDPEKALCDGRQAVRPEALPGLIRQLREISAIALKAEAEERK